MIYTLISFLDSLFPDVVLVFFILNIYLLVAFSISTYDLIENGNDISFVFSLIIRDKKLLIEIFVFFIFIFFLYFIVSLPIVVIFLIKQMITPDGTAAIEFGMPTNIIVGAIDVFFGCVFQLIAGSSISCLIKYRVGTISAIKKGLITIIGDVRICVLVLVLNFVLKGFELMGIGYINRYILGLIFPLIILLCYLNLKTECANKNEKSVVTN